MYGTCCLLNIYHDLKDEWKFVQAWTLMRKKWFSNACTSHTQFCSPITLTLLSCCKRMSAHSCTNKIRSFGEYVFTYAALKHTKYVESWAIFMNHITIFKPSSYSISMIYSYSIHSVNSGWRKIQLFNFIFIAMQWVELGMNGSLSYSIYKNIYLHQSEDCIFP